MSGPRAQFGQVAVPVESPVVPATGRARGPGPSTAVQAVAARRVGARVGRAPMPALRPAAPVALVLVPGQLAPRRHVSGTGRGLRGPIAVPVLALAVVVLTWVDAGMLRAKHAGPQAAVDSLGGSAGEDATAQSALPGPLGVVRTDHANDAPETTASDLAVAANADEPEPEQEN